MWPVPISPPGPFPLRYITDSQGHCYLVHLAPHEQPGALGVHPYLSALCFETEQGLWMGSLLALPGVTLEQFTLRELRHLLAKARAGSA